MRDGIWLVCGICPRAKPGQGSTQLTRCTHLRDGSKQRGYHVTDRINLVELQHPPEGGTQLRPEGWHWHPAQWAAAD